MIVYRIDREKRRHDLLSGKGAQEYGGRWNPIGTKAVYTAQHISLAYLEVVMHLNIASDLPDDRILLHIEIPDELEVIKVSRLPKDWNTLPYNRKTQDIFTRFCSDHKAAVLQVPSAVVPKEHNFIINPLHPDFEKISVKKVEKFSFDERLMR